jgi:RNA-directed DNA polymerase
MSPGSDQDGGMSPGLARVAARAKRETDARFNSLAHLIEPGLLSHLFTKLRGNAAVGIDGISKAEYGQNLDSNLQDLHARMKAMKYRHQPIKRVHIPKPDGRTRPIGISATEDKLVQEALRVVMQSIYEQDFMDSSYGFRPGRSCHDALRALDRMVTKEGYVWILEADIQAFFDNVDRAKLRELLQIRIADGAFLRLVGKCLNVGVLDNSQFMRPEEGTVQGSTLSPLLGNVYLHYALDKWFETELRPELGGRGRLIRYADDFLAGFDSKAAAEKALEKIRDRLEIFGLKLHPSKTRIIGFQRPRGDGKGGPRETFDFLGFTHYWRKSRNGYWVPAMKTRRARMTSAMQRINDWCRRQRHQPMSDQHAGLKRRLRGHMNYFGVNGNGRCIKRIVRYTTIAWHKWLNRRSQTKRLNWKRFNDLLRAYPLPEAKIYVRIWAT